jgi:hypothetical protein
MRFAILIHRTPSFWTDLNPTQTADLVGAYLAYVEAARSGGVLVAADQLQGAATAKIVGETGVVDGPYTDEKEELGGVFLIDVANEDEALAWAAKCPGAAFGRGVEVRPVVQR